MLILIGVIEVDATCILSGVAFEYRLTINTLEEAISCALKQYFVKQHVKEIATKSLPYFSTCRIKADVKNGTLGKWKVIVTSSL